MYERFYNLRERPFSLSPDPDYLYPSRVHREALGYLRYGIEGHAGFVVITGDIGCGKTTLLQTMIRGLDRQTSISRLVNTMLDAHELLEAVMLDFGLDPGVNRSKPYLLRDLARFLVEQRNAGRLAMLVVDEAQNLSPTALEEVRMLSNLETEKSKLIQIVLVGQPSLRTLLSRPELEQLRQRVTVSYHLKALDAEDTAAYVNFRLKRAAIGAPLEFPRQVTDIIHLHSQGVPRKINVIADAILLFGYGEERRLVDVALAREVVEELEATGVIASPSGTWATEPAPVAPLVTEEGPSAREARLAERERLVAEQQRVLLEEYRLLHERPVPAPLSAESGANATRWPPVSSTVSPAVSATPPARVDAPVTAAPARTAPATPSTSAEPSTSSASAAPQRAVAAPVPPRPAQTPTPVVQPRAALAAPTAPQQTSSGGSVAPAPRPPTAARIFSDAPRPEGLWARMRRGLFGTSKPLLED